MIFPVISEIEINFEIATSADVKIVELFNSKIAQMWDYLNLREIYSLTKTKYMLFNWIQLKIL